MYQDNKIWIGMSGEEKIYIYPKMANRHGMIAGATGTGKTVTLKVMAESFSDAGVPVFLADVKGDLSGMCAPGTGEGSVGERMDALALSGEGFTLHAYPTSFWDVYGQKGMSLRTTISEMGPILLSRILDLNDTQSDLLSVLFKIADDEQMLLLDTKDLKAFINYVGENADSYASAYGSIAKASLNVIIRSLVALEAEGGEDFFTEPALNINEMMTCEYDGRGRINILDCVKLINNPRMYSAFMLWLLTELYSTLPEAGDLDKPKLVFFFDEAHLMFANTDKALLEKIEQIVKLIRSKGVGIYFITQNPQDIPDGILDQLGNKVQHALRAYTPKEMKGAKIAAESFRANPDFDTLSVLTELGVGEALVSVLDEKGVPTVVKRTSILPPQSYPGAIDDEVRKNVISNNPLYGKYAEVIDRLSAYELLEQKAKESIKAAEAADAKEAAPTPTTRNGVKLNPSPSESSRSYSARHGNSASSKSSSRSSSSGRRDSEDATSKALKKAAKSVSSTAASTIGRELGNSMGGSSSFGKKLGGNVGASIGRNLMGLMFK